jgi:O-antigen ligase/tetratricopeptide (TPR) repeat protein
MALIYGVLFTPMIVSTSLFFPYITGKAFAFRFLVEAATALYIVLVIFDRSYLPKKGSILTAIIAFTAVLGLSTLNAEDPSKSFWSNFERMEGYVTILHLFCFFVVASVVFRTKQAWYGLFNTSIAISIALGLRAFADYNPSRSGAFIVEMFRGIKYFFVAVFGSPENVIRVSGSLGNSSYLGVYSLIHAFLAGLMLVTLVGIKKFKDAPLRYIAYICAIIFNIIVLYNTGTRGSFVGLVAGSLVTVSIPLMMVVFGKNTFNQSVSESLKKKIKIAGAIAVVCILIVIGLLGKYKESDFVKSSNLLYRFSSLITTDIKGVLATQGESRTLLWGMSWKGVQERPLLGWGQDNFPYVFAKYYDPKMYAQEQWFDRTHNVFFDWLIAGGLLGLASYLGLFFVLIYVLWRKTVLHKENVVYDVLEKSVLTGLLTAYFVHNLFIFDNLASYILFFILLAYVHQQHLETPKITTQPKALFDSPTAQSALILVTILVFGYVSNEAVYKPYMAGKTLIQALQYSQPETMKALGEERASPKIVFNLFEKALAYDTFANTEIRERLAEVAPSVMSMTKDEALIKSFSALVADEYKEATLKNPNDPRPFVFMAMYLQKFGLYTEALSYMDKAIELSPTKQSFYHQKAIIQVTIGKNKEAVETFKKAYDLEPASKESKVLYALGLIYDNNFAEARKILGNDINALNDQRILETLLEKKMINEVVELGKLKISSDPTNPQGYMSLAGLYLKIKRPADAIEQIRKVIELSPDFKQAGEYYISEIQAGRDPSQPNTKR